MNSCYIDVVHTDKTLCCWSRDMDGKLHYHEEPESDYSYLFIPDNTGKKPIYFDMYKRPMKKVMFDSVWDMRDYAKSSSVTHESDVPLV